MNQQFKSLYFPDAKGAGGTRQCLTLAFGPEDATLFDGVSTMSSVELRGLLGHNTLASVRKAAAREDRSINAYCLRKLSSRREAVANSVRPKDPNLSLLATFRGGEQEPLHRWYPYLEGYSPGFVRLMLERYAPDAHDVLDPFGGVGTTPLTCSGMGLRGAYCEINPLLQRLVAAKAATLAMSVIERERLASGMLALAKRLPALCRKADPDNGLAWSYRRTFGESVFFDTEVLDLVLRMRGALDAVALDDPRTALYAEIAVCGRLLEVSRLIRRGDVRFRTDNEKSGRANDLLAETRDALAMMADDLENAPYIAEPPVFLCADAKRLANLPERKIGAVLTSPPYINGTNYFRNTKVELWFMRCLRHAGDLSAFRARAVTGGINDVTKGKAMVSIPEQARQVVRALERDAYDRRIPVMVGAYFADMAAVMDGFTPHLEDGAPVMIDIGDSNYANTHVPVEKILKEMFAERGYQPVDDVTLRKRSSRGGRELRQALLVFRHRKGCSPKLREDSPSRPWWHTRWQRFKKELPHQHGFFAKRNWGHGLHSLCSYQGKLKPAIAHFLTRTFVPAGGAMLDPFGGVGTIPFEAAQQGMTSWSFDISPAALRISRGKLGGATPDECHRVLEVLANRLEKPRATAAERAAAEKIRFNGPLAEYFSPETFAEILTARRFFRELEDDGAAASLVMACLLHILHGNRPYALSRRSHPITPFAPTGDAEYRALMPRLRDKVERSLAEELPADFMPGVVIEQDACGFWPQEVRDLDAVITSPPFFDSTRFYLANWMRLWFCGWEAEDFKVRPQGYVDERQKKNMGIYEPIFRQARERLKPGGVMVLHLGESRKCDMAAHLKHVARHWFRVADEFRESVEHCESHGIRDKGAVTAHQFLVLE